MSDSRSSSPGKDVDGRVSSAKAKNKCPKCNHYIQAGSIEVDGVHYHPKCFVCMKCGTTCRIGNYQRVTNKFYCQNCCDKTPALYNEIRAAKQKMIDDEKKRQQAIIDEENARKQAIIDAENAEIARKKALMEAENARIQAELEAKNKSFTNIFTGKGSPGKKSNPEKSKVIPPIQKHKISSQAQEKPRQTSQVQTKALSQQLPPPPPVEETTPEDVWVEVKDENTGKSYWWNQESNETTALDAPKPQGFSVRPVGNQTADSGGCGCVIN